jgi:positive regulator of sigma E activity
LPTSNWPVVFMKRSASHGNIQHDGTVKKVDGDSVLVSITSSPACAGCHAEGLCGLTGKEEKLIDVKGKYNVSPGDPVTILMEETTGFKAVALSYLVPFIIVISSLFIFSSMSFSELATGLISILLLVPYFIILYLFREKINRSITFTLKS